MTEPIKTVPPSEVFVEMPFDSADYIDDPPTRLEDLDPDERKEALRRFAEQDRINEGLKP